MPEQTNPAKRLYDILNTLISAESNFSGDPPVKACWMSAFEIEQDKDFYDSVSKVVDLVRLYEQAVMRNNTADTSKYLRILQAIQEGMFNVSSETWYAFRGRFDDNFMLAMQLACDSMYWDAEEVVSEGDLEELQSEVEALINKVVSADLNDELKRVLADGLGAVRQAILDYRISGAEGLKQALSRNIDLIIRYRDEFKEADETEDGKAVVSGFRGVLKRLDGLVSVGLKVKQLVEPVIERLMLGGGN